MNVTTQPADGGDPELAALLIRLFEAEAALQSHLAGRWDHKTGASGRPGRLSTDQEERIAGEAAETQVAILDSLPAHLALIDGQGVIQAVNEAWRCPSSANSLQGPEFAVGQNYLRICESATGECSKEAHDAAAGILQVLRGGVSGFTLNYSCRSPNEQRWFRLIVSPLRRAGLEGAVVMHLNVTEWERAEEGLRESEASFRGTFERAAIGIAHVSVEGRFLQVNDKLCAILGHARENLLGMAFADLTIPEDRASGLEARRAMLAGEQSTFTTEKRYRQGDGKVVWVNLATTLERTATGEPKYFISVFEDITPRKQAEFRLHRLNRLHSVLSRTGETAVRTRKRQDLYSSICRIIVEDGRLRMALVVELDETLGLVRQAAFYGEGLEYLDELTITLVGPQSLGTIGTALRTGDHDFCNDFSADPRMVPWRERAFHFGFLAAASFPLKLGDVTIGALTLFSGEAGYFQDDELALMDAVAGNISFAVERQRVEAALRTSQSSMAVAQQIAHFGSWELDLMDVEHPDANSLRWSDEMFRIAGFEPGSRPVTNEFFFSLVPAEEHEEIREALAAAIRDRCPYSFIHRLIRPDGEVRFVNETAQMSFDERSGRPLRMIGTAHDITEHRRVDESLRQSQSMLRIAGRLGRIGAWSVDIPGYNVTWSDEVRVIHEVPPGFTPSIDEAMDFYAPEFRETVRRAFAVCVRDGAPFELESQIISANQQRTWVRCIGEVVRGAEGRIIRIQGAVQDVTRQKAAEETARFAGARLFETLESITDGFFTLDPDWKFTYVNAEAERLLKCLRTSLLGHTLWEAFPALVGSQFEREYLRAVVEKCTTSFEEYYPPLDQWFEVKANPYSEGLAVYFREVTERRRNREALRASEARFRSLVQSSWDVFYLLATDGRIIYESPAVTRVLGYQPEEMVGRNIMEFVHPDDVGVVEAGSEVHLTTPGSQRSITFRMHHRDGFWRWVESFEVNLLDNPDVGGIAVNFRDITERRQAEARIAEQAALIDEAHDAIILRDLEHRINFWNRGAERVFGWTAAEALGRIFPELVQVDPVRFAEADRSVRTNGEWNGEFQKSDKNNAKLVFAARWTLLRDERGNARAILSIDTDITERKKLEQQFLRAQRMESIGTLAGGIAHDLNNALTPIIMSIDLLKVELDEAERLEIISTIETSAQRCANMVNQVLCFARGVEGQMSVVQPRHLLRDMQKMASETFPKNIEIKVRTDSYGWSVNGDPTQLHQVILNLCVNARDAMPGGGILLLLAENVMLDESFVAANVEAKVGPYVLVQVQDNGTGIPAEIVEKIFDPFFTTKEFGKGTGLGLSTSMAIVRSHGGFLGVYSEPGRGTTFKIYLPANVQEQAEELAQQEKDLPRGNGELILIIDDEASVRQITGQTLEAFGYLVIVACDGAEAVALYAQNRVEIALVLTDMMMPVMDGPATIQVLMKLNPQVKLIAASGISVNAHVARAAGAGVTHFLPKPYMAETLLKMIREVLGNAAK